MPETSKILKFGNKKQVRGTAPLPETSAILKLGNKKQVRGTVLLPETSKILKLGNKKQVRGTVLLPETSKILKLGNKKQVRGTAPLPETFVILKLGKKQSSKRNISLPEITQFIEIETNIERRIMSKPKAFVPFDLTSQITSRIETLNSVIEKTESALISYPEGKIHVSPGTSKGNYRYFERTDSLDKTGVYLHKKEDKKIKSLCQKKYLEEVYKKCSQELNVLENMLKKYEGDSILNSFTSLNEGIKKQVNPILLDNNTYTKLWLSQEYKGLSFDEADKSEFYTDKGERVRSKSEIIIANYLYHHNIPYLYEKPITFKNGRTVYPDFTILDVFERREKYLEHLGKLGDVDYLMRNIQKLNEYKENGIYLGLDLFFTYESLSNPFSVKDLEVLLKGMEIL